MIGAEWINENEQIRIDHDSGQIVVSVEDAHKLFAGMSMLLDVPISNTGMKKLKLFKTAPTGATAAIRQEIDAVPPIPEVNNINEFAYDWCDEFHDMLAVVKELNLRIDPHELENWITRQFHHFLWCTRGDDTILIVQSRAHFKVYVWNNRSPLPRIEVMGHHTPLNLS